MQSLSTTMAMLRRTAFIGFVVASTGCSDHRTDGSALSSGSTPVLAICTNVPSQTQLIEVNTGKISYAFTKADGKMLDKLLPKSTSFLPHGISGPFGERLVLASANVIIALKYNATSESFCYEKKWEFPKNQWLYTPSISLDHSGKRLAFVVPNAEHQKKYELFGWMEGTLTILDLDNGTFSEVSSIANSFLCTPQWGANNSRIIYSRLDFPDTSRMGHDHNPSQYIVEQDLASGEENIISADIRPIVDVEGVSLYTESDKADSSDLLLVRYSGTPFKERDRRLVPGGAILIAVLKDGTFIVGTSSTDEYVVEIKRTPNGEKLRELVRLKNGFPTYSVSCGVK